MPKRKTHEEFVAEVKELVGDEYEVLGMYKNCKTKIAMKHNKCGYDWGIKPSNFLSGNRCPKCAGKTRDTKQFRREVHDLTNGEYELIGEFKKVNEYTEIKHIKCGNVYKVRPSKFTYGQRCPQCYRNIRKTTEQFKQEVFELEENNYTVLGEYKNTHSKLLIRHNVCGKEYEVAPADFLSGKRCSRCRNVEKKNTESFKNELYELVGNEYTLISEYINTNKHVKMRHENCGHEWNIKPTNFLSGKRCPKCAESKGEQRIRHWLEDNNIKFVPQRKYPDLIGTGGGLLSYDFYLPDYNLLIEYQGQFHDGNGNDYIKQNLETQKEHDRRKKEYAEQHNIQLLEIWYWDFVNIEEILNKEISNLLPQLI